MFTKYFVLGKRSEACRDAKKDDNKIKDTISFDAYTPVIEEDCKNQPDFCGLPLKKFKKMSLKSVEVAKLSKDIEQECIIKFKLPSSKSVVEKFLHSVDTLQTINNFIASLGFNKGQFIIIKHPRENLSLRNSSEVLKELGISKKERLIIEKL